MKTIVALLFLSIGAVAHLTYTGYSGAPGSNGTCASSCHGAAGGTLVLSSVPTSYTPLRSYTLVAKHNGGSKITNLNISSRVGGTSTGAGTFAAGTGSSPYSVPGVESGVHCTSGTVDSITFVWTAPAAGTGSVKMFAAGIQGGITGNNSTVVATIAESTTEVAAPDAIPLTFRLEQNYPNPFNPATNIEFSVPASGHVSLKVYNIAGEEVGSLFDGMVEAGQYRHVVFDGAAYATGIYVARLTYEGRTLIRKMVLLK